MAIYVWGTGCGASELVEQGLNLARITAFVDSYPSGDTFLGKPVLLPEQLSLDDCELLIVTTRHTDAVANRCRQLEIPENKLLFLKNNYELSDRNAACSIAGELLGEDLRKKLLPKQRIVPTPASLVNAMLPERELSNDYVRLATLELLCRRLETVSGAAAELGVYRGFFARCINTLLPDRRLYLFDSFEGFEAEADASESFHAAHANTTVEKVLAIMPHRSQVTVKPGFFPASLDGLEERFCLVSLDVDFAQATLEGLRYFWPRLQKGGYLMLHDWGSPSLPGVAQALKTYEEEIGASISAIPLCDVGGTLVLCK
ncbi:MAG: class I SAM-dependent methyltransferase [Oscillospiraceae bacterium]|nr:class I SAM-dependent methyltransferase [Oscillospiraceae bacterium]